VLNTPVIRITKDQLNTPIVYGEKLDVFGAATLGHAILGQCRLGE
jgi:hypothetical protein